MTDTKSEEDISFSGIENSVEKDKSDVLEQISKIDEACQFDFENAVCKCVENFKKTFEKKIDLFPLPSTVTDREEMYFPNDISKEDPTIYGKWLIFSNGNLRLQDHLWIQLHSLLQSKDLILLESSTAKLIDNRGPFQGVIKCYTTKDISVIRHAGLAIQNILNDQTILDYKTNEASQNNMYRANGNRFITKFKLTVNGKLYKRDKLGRWIQFTDSEYHNFNFDENFFGLSNYVVPSTEVKQLLSVSSSVPSLETSKKMKRYVYPDGTHLSNLSGLWCLFCNVTDADGNGFTELDYVWSEAKALCDEEFFTSVTCETRAFKPHAKETRSRRTVMCEIYDPGINHVIECADKLRERLSYNMPMYYKICMYNQFGTPECRLKYLYTEDKELYEFTEDKWKLVKRV